MPAGPPPMTGTTGARDIVARSPFRLMAHRRGCMRRHGSPECGRAQALEAGPRGSLMVSMTFEHDLKESIRTIPDYPKPGIMFRDITTLLGNARAFRRAVDELVQPWAGMKIDKVAGIEARGFILGGAVA